MSKIKFLFTSFCFSFASCMISSHSLAHDIWVTFNEEDNQYKAQIHHGDFDAREYADKFKVVSLDVVSSAGNQMISRPYESKELYGQPTIETSSFYASPDAMISVTYDNGYWIHRPSDNKSVNSNKLLVPSGSDTHWTYKYGKALLGIGAYKRVMNTRLEIIPLKDPYALADGEKLPIRVVLDGKPLAELDIGVADGLQLTPEEDVPSVTTNDEGIAEIELMRKGPYVLITDYYASPKSPALADKDHIYTSLSFDTSK